MKHLMAILYWLILIIGISLSQSCSTMKVSETYKSNEIESIKNHKVLVISQSPDETVRKEYEVEIANTLQKSGISAVPSHSVFADLSGFKKRAKENVEEVISTFRNAGYDIILLTALKDVQELVKVQREGGYNSFTEYYGNQYVTLKGYYDDVHAPPSLPPKEVEPSTNYITANKYIMEAVVYNLSFAKEKRLLAIITTEVTDPNSGDTVRKEFAKAIRNKLD